MTEQEIRVALAQVNALPRNKRAPLLDDHTVKYFVQMTYPYCCFVRDEAGYDLFHTFDMNEAVEFCNKMEEKHSLCDYAVFSLKRED